MLIKLGPGDGRGTTRCPAPADGFHELTSENAQFNEVDSGPHVLLKCDCGLLGAHLLDKRLFQFI